MRALVKPAVVVAAAVFAWSAAPAGAVHESHHGPFVGRTDQGERIVWQCMAAPRNVLVRAREH